MTPCGDVGSPKPISVARLAHLLSQRFGLSGRVAGQIEASTEGAVRELEMKNVHARSTTPTNNLTRARQDLLLDRALRETFPASDPVSPTWVN